MTSRPLRGTPRSWQWRALASVFPLALACNALTGVNDLEFKGPTTDSSDLLPDPALNAVSTGDAGGSGGMGANSSQPPPPCNLSTEDRCIAPPLSKAPLYSACATDADCIAPYRCLSDVCSKLCQAAADCDWPGASCISSAGDPREHCSRNCDLVTTSEPRMGLQACGDGLRCTFVPDPASAGAADCSVPPKGSYAGAPCKADAECLPNFNCFSGHCVSACAASASTCPDGQTCGGLSIRAGQEVGSCCSVPAGQKCSLLTDCGCGPGETCAVADDTGRTQCRALPDLPVAPYAGCTRDDACPALHSCRGGACKLHCDSAGDCGSEGVSCVPSTGADGKPIAGFSVCSRGCDLVSPEEPALGLRSCGSGSTCARFSNPTPLTDCAKEGAGVQGSSCTLDRDCAAGFGCLFRTCQRWCGPDTAACAAGLTCSSVFSRAGRDLGSCCQPPTGQACEWGTDCGCGARETCALDDSNTRVCRPTSATAVAAYGACTSEAQCPAFYTCVGRNCMQRCLDDAQCSATGAVCIPFSDAKSGEGVCSRTCDALAPQAPAAGFQPCASGLTCVISGTDASYCFTPGSLAAGDECTSALDCSTGLSCYQNVCRRFCDLAASACANGTTCKPGTPAIPSVGGRSLGLCLPN